MKRLSVALLVLLALASPAGAGLPAQTDARDNPMVSGPLELSDKQCNRTRERHDGQLVAYTRICIRLYAFQTDQETDVQRDYGTVWLQTNVNAENGWCAKMVRSQIGFPNDVAILNRNPKPETTTHNPVTMRQRIVNSAGGNALANARVRQSFVFFPNKQTRRQLDDGRKQRLVWRGSEDRKLFFQTAANFSWSVLNSPGQFSSGLGFRFEEDNTC